MLRDYAIQHLVTFCQENPFSVGRCSADATNSSWLPRHVDYTPEEKEEVSGVVVATPYQTAISTLLEAAQSSTTTAGTALLGLHRLEGVLTAKNAEKKESVVACRAEAERRRVGRCYVAATYSSWLAYKDDNAAEQKEKNSGVVVATPYRRPSSETLDSATPDEINTLALHLATAPEISPIVRITAIQVCAERGITKALPVIRDFSENSQNFVLQRSAKAALKQLIKPEFSTNHL